MVETFIKTTSDPIGQTVLGLFQIIIKEVEAWESEDLTILEIMATIFSEQAKNINDLKSIIMSLASKDESLNTQLVKIEERVEKRLKFDKKLDEFLKEWKKEKEKRREEREKVWIYT